MIFTQNPQFYQGFHDSFDFIIVWKRHIKIVWTTLTYWLKQENSCQKRNKKSDPEKKQVQKQKAKKDQKPDQIQNHFFRRRLNLRYLMYDLGLFFWSDPGFLLFYRFLFSLISEWLCVAELLLSLRSFVFSKIKSWVVYGYGWQWLLALPFSILSGFS